MVFFFVVKFFKKRDILMKFIRFLGILCMLIPGVACAAGSAEFQNASKLLSAARRGDIQTVQVLVNSGVDVNYVDATGLSLVCTAVMNNDKQAIQILQMYGADASKCDRQIKQYKQKTRVAKSGNDYGFFSGLSSSHVLALSAVGVAAVIGGIVLLTKVLDDKGGGSGSGSNGNRPNNNNSGDNGGGSSNTVALFTQNLPYGPACSEDGCPNDFSFWETTKKSDFDYLSANGSFNYLMVARAYNAFVRGYEGMGTIRNPNTLVPFDLSSLLSPFPSLPGGDKPINVAIITKTGVNATAGTSLADDLIEWIPYDQISLVQTACANDVNSAGCQAAWVAALEFSHKYHNLSGTTVSAATEVAAAEFDLSGSGSVFGSATDSDNKLAKIIAGWEAGGRANADFTGFVPNGQLTVYKIGSGEIGVSDYKNYAAIKDALQLQSSAEHVVNVVANLSLPGASNSLSYATVNDSKILYDAASTDALKQSVFLNTIDTYYNLNTNDDATVNKPSQDADSAFVYLKNYQKQILVNPAGRYLFGLGEGKSLTPLVATFENFAPVIYNDSNNGLQNLFASVVAVKPGDGTADDTIDGYSASGAGKLGLSAWADENDNTITYSSRMCGLAGTGNNGAMNPWCFAAPGNTDLEATAAMAGSIALVKSAFNYMTPKQVFLLLALTADGPFLSKEVWSETDESLEAYLRNMYTLPSHLDSSDAQYLESFKTAFGYGMINLERATKPGTNVYFYSSDKNTIVSASGNAYWGKGKTTTSSARASTVLSLTNRKSIKTAFYDVLESGDGSLSLPRVWNTTLASGDDYRHGLYMGDVLAEFAVDSTNKHSNQIGNMTFDMALSPRAYNDNLSGLDDLHVAFQNENYDIDAQYQRFLVDGQSRFDGRANSVLALTSNALSMGAKYKVGNFAFGGRAFSGTITDENLLEKDPVVSSQFEPARLGFANGMEAIAGYTKDKFSFNMTFGNMHESNTVLGMYSDGLLNINGGDTRYVDLSGEYSPFENVKLLARATFANTHVNDFGGVINNVSDIKSNAFAIGTDIGGFEFTASMPLAVVDGKMGYDYADLNVVEDNGSYSIAVNNPHVEYVDLSARNRELRFSTSYKKLLGEWTDAGLGMIYRVHPNNTDEFGNESIFMFKLHHRLGI